MIMKTVLFTTSLLFLVLQGFTAALSAPYSVSLMALSTYDVDGKDTGSFNFKLRNDSASMIYSVSCRFSVMGGTNRPWAMEETLVRSDSGNGWRECGDFIAPKETAYFVYRTNAMNQVRHGDCTVITVDFKGKYQDGGFWSKSLYYQFDFSFLVRTNEDGGRLWIPSALWQTGVMVRTL